MTQTHVFNKPSVSSSQRHTLRSIGHFFSFLEVSLNPLSLALTVQLYRYCFSSLLETTLANLWELILNPWGRFADLVLKAQSRGDNGFGSLNIG